MAEQLTSVQETERKYETDEHARLPDPSRLLNSAVEEGEQQLDATYYDTADLRLLRAGITMRRRAGGHDAGWHLKLPVGPDTREELRLPLGESEIPADLVTLTRLPTRGEQLVPVARLITDRRRWVLSDSDGKELAEVVADEVTADYPDSGAPAMRWREIEVELGAHGRPELLDRIEHELIAVGAWRSPSPSKLSRVLGGRLTEVRRAEPKPQRGRKGSAGAVVMEYLAGRAEQIRSRDVGVRRDLPDSVHQMRVGAREMRSILQGFGRVLDREATADLVAELKWLGGELADARDSEVLAEQFAASIDALPEELVLGPIPALVIREMAEATREGRERALAALDSDRYLRLHGMIDELLTDPPFTDHAAAGARQELPRSVAKAFRRTAQRITIAMAGEPGPDQDIALHEARKAAKRLRYVTELAAPAVGGRTKRLVADLKAMHKLLGAHQDCVVARPVLRRFAVEAHRHGANGFTFGILHAEQELQARRLRAELPAAWRALSRRVASSPFGD